MHTYRKSEPDSRDGWAQGPASIPCSVSSPLLLVFRARCSRGASEAVTHRSLCCFYNCVALSGIRGEGEFAHRKSYLRACDGGVGGLWRRPTDWNRAH